MNIKKITLIVSLIFMIVASFVFYHKRYPITFILFKIEKTDNLIIKYSYFYSTGGEEIKHGFYRIEDLVYKKNNIQINVIKNGCYINGEKNGLWISRDPLSGYECFSFYVKNKLIMADIFINQKKISTDNKIKKEHLLYHTLNTCKLNDSQFLYYFSPENHKVKHGFHRIDDVEYKKITNKIGYTYEGCYINGKKNGLWISSDPFLKSKRYYFYIDDKLTMEDVFINGKKISSLTYKNNKPLKGTLFDLSSNLTGLQFCEIKSYNDGKIVKTQNCDFFGNILKAGQDMAKEEDISRYMDKEMINLREARYWLRRKRKIPEKLLKEIRGVGIGEQ